MSIYSSDSDRSMDLDMGIDQVRKWSSEFKNDRKMILHCEHCNGDVRIYIGHKKSQKGCRGVDCRFRLISFDFYLSHAIPNYVIWDTQL